MIPIDLIVKNIYKHSTYDLMSVLPHKCGFTLEIKNPNNEYISPF